MMYHCNVSKHVLVGNPGKTHVTYHTAIMTKIIEIKMALQHT